MVDEKGAVRMGRRLTRRADDARARVRHPNRQPRETSPPSVAFVADPNPKLTLDDLDSHLAYPLHLGLPSSLSSPSSPSLPFVPFEPL